VQDELIHSLAAGYALHALSPDEERAFEAHLAGCRQCREELASLSEAASALAFAAPPGRPPAGLRGRILDAARADRPNVVRLRPRWAYPALAVAAVALGVAVSVGVWAASMHSQLHSTQTLRALPVKGASGSVIVGRNGAAALVVSGLPPAPSGKTYEVWVIRGTTAEPAGFLTASSGTTRLTRQLRHGARVAVTLERTGGAPRPTSAPLLTSAPA
jgi:anti-sigma-K factor RskA